jgi:tetratricopeptide (TPR) repeat protein
VAPDAYRPLLAEVAEAWGQDCQRRAVQSAGAAAGRLQEEATRHFQEAGDLYASLADDGGPGQPNWLWLAANSYLRGHDHARAAPLLERYVQVEADPARLGGGWYALAEVRRKLPDEPAARHAYQKCIEYQSPFGYRARFRLAVADIEQARRERSAAKLEDAERALQHNLDLMRFNPDDEAFEKTLLTLAELLSERGNYRQAVIRLQEVLDRYPNTPRQLAVRVQLAECCRRLAAQEDAPSPAEFPPDGSQPPPGFQRRRWLQSAVANYQKIVEVLAARAAGGPLSAAEENFLRHALTAAADCQFEQLEYAEAVSYYEELAVRYHHQVEAYKALKQIVRCYWLLAGSADTSRQKFFMGKARETIQRACALLKELPETAFGEKPGLLARPEEDAWITRAWSYEPPPGRAGANEQAPGSP